MHGMLAGMKDSDNVNKYTVCVSLNANRKFIV